MSLLIVVDTETTGLDPGAGCVWDLGAVALRDGCIVGEFESLVRPHPDRFQREQRAVVKRISRLDDAGLLALFDAPPVRVVEDRLAEWWRSFSPAIPVTFTSFNVAFDSKFLIHDPWELGYAPWGPCVMEACREPMAQAGLLQRTSDGQRWKWPKLTAACAFFHIPFEETHCALSDARAAAALAIRLGLSAPAMTSPTLALEF